MTATATAGVQSSRIFGRRVAFLVKSARPAQWPKNALVLAPVLAANAWGRPGVLASAAVALISFTLIASAVYLVNDVCDQERDRLHPRKRLRPIASGRLPRSWAIRGAACAVAAGFGLAAATHQGELAWVLAGYLGISLAYSVWLKNLPVVELLIVAYGFVWRPVAGAEATGIAASGWFLAVCCFAALAVAIGKRYSEITRLDNAATQHRRSLRAYRPAALRVARRVASLATVACYCGWAVSRRAGLPLANGIWAPHAGFGQRVVRAQSQAMTGALPPSLSAGSAASG